MTKIKLQPVLNRMPALSFKFFFFLILAGHVILRLCTLLTTPLRLLDVHEEYYLGSIPLQILHGLESYLWDYQKDPYTPGSFLAGGFTAFFFILLGPSLFSLKLTGVTFSATTLAAAGVFLKRHVSVQAAILGMLLLTFPAPGFYGMSLLTLGAHGESALFAILSFWMYTELFRDPKNCFRSALFLGCSLALGLGFSPVFIAVVFTLFLCLMLQFYQIPQPLKTISGLVLGFGIGLIPWLLYNMTHGFEGILYLWRELGATHDHSGHSFSLLTDSLKAIRMFFQSFYFREDSPFLHKALPLFHGSLLIMGYFFAIKKTKDLRNRPQHFFFLLFPAVFFVLAVYLVSHLAWEAEDSPHRYRYFTCLYLILCVGAAAGFSSFKIAWHRSIPVLIILLSLFGLRNYFFRGEYGELLRMPGYSIESYERLQRNLSFAPGFKKQTPDFPEQAASQIVQEQTDFSSGLAVCAWDLDSGKPSFTEKNLKPDSAKWFYRGCGASFLRYLPNLGHFQDSSELLLSAIPAEFHEDFFWGLGRDIADRHQNKKPELFKIYMRGLPVTQAEWITQGYEDYYP